MHTTPHYASFTLGTLQTRDTTKSNDSGFVVDSVLLCSTCRLSGTARQSIPLES